MAWAELCGDEIVLSDKEKSIAKISGTVVIDAKALYDILLKRDMNSSGAGLKDKFSALEVLCLLESLERLSTNVRWVHSEAQVADALTKPLPPGVLHKILCEGKWILQYDPTFTSAKRLKNGKKEHYSKGFWGVSVSKGEQLQPLCMCEVF